MIIIKKTFESEYVEFKFKFEVEFGYERTFGVILSYKWSKLKIDQTRGQIWLKNQIRPNWQ